MRVSLAVQKHGWTEKRERERGEGGGRDRAKSMQGMNKMRREEG